jgi:hypothetical protein
LSSTAKERLGLFSAYEAIMGTKSGGISVVQEFTLPHRHPVLHENSGMNKSGGKSLWQ